jgi:hypothetical protein
MQLREACVDLNGQVAAAGRIEYPSDRAGYFPLPNHQRVRASMFGTRLRLAAANAERDEKTNFLVSREAGPVVFVPESFTTIIWNALRRIDEPTIEAHLADQQETLESCGDREVAKMQPLSDWRLHISTIDGTLKIKLSASLQATQQIPAWQQKSTSNFWVVTNDIAPRITIEFDVDAVTRVVSYGFVGLAGLDGASATLIEPCRNSLVDMKLDNAPIGGNGRLYGYTTQESWVSLYEARSGGVAISPARLKRYPNGFVTDSNDYFWPRIWLDAFDMKAVVRAVRNTFKLTIELNDGYFGHLQQHHLFHESYVPSPRQSILRARLDFQLDLFGLSLNYDLFVNDLHPSRNGNHSSGWLPGQIILPWELLIIRYPVLSNDRARILATQDNSKPDGNVR